MRRLNISQRLGMTAVLFLLPTVYLLWQLDAAQHVEVDFTSKEVAGAAELAGVLAVEAALDQSLLEGKVPDPALAQRIIDLDAAQAGLLDTATQAADAAAALRAVANPAGVTTARGKVRDLITRIGDRSNLILDNVLDTYHLTDVVLNRLPDVLDRITDQILLAAVVKAAPQDADAKAQFLLGLGSLQAVIDGMSSSMDAAQQDNQDGTIAGKLAADFAGLKKHITDYAGTMVHGDASAEAAAPLLAQAASFSAIATEELHSLLAARVHHLRAQLLLRLAVSLALILSAAAAMFLLVRHSLIRPLRKLQRAIQGLIDGDLDSPIPEPTGRDEVSRVLASAIFFRQALRTNAELSDAKERGDRERLERQERIDQLTRQFGHVIGEKALTVSAAADQLSRNATVLMDSSENTASNAASAQRRSSLATSNATVVASATEQLAASSREIAEQIERSAAATQGAVARANEVRSQVLELMGVVTGVGEVLSFINDIAAKTNLLALNATIEAARAGDAGRGFAVVAQEVKGLAAQTATATGDISARIEAVRSAAAQAGEGMRAIADLIADINVRASAVAAAVAEQGAATGEISRNVQEAASNTMGVSDMVTDVRSDADRNGEAAREVLENATALATQSEMLRDDIRAFLRDMEAERRHHPRYDADLDLLLADEGKQARGRLVNLSIGGAAIASDLAVTPHGKLVVSGLVEDSVNAEVVSARSGIIHVAFAHDARSEAAVRRLVSVISREAA